MVRKLVDTIVIRKFNNYFISSYTLCIVYFDYQIIIQITIYTQRLDYLRYASLHLKKVLIKLQEIWS